MRKPPSHEGISESMQDEGRAERLGHQFGFAIGHMRQQLQHMVTNHLPGAEHTTHEERPSHESATDEASHPSSSSSLHRAEDIVDNASHRLSEAVSRTGTQLQKVTTRVREEAEDILAEARYLRHPPADKPTPGNHTPSRPSER